MSIVLLERKEWIKENLTSGQATQAIDAEEPWYWPPGQMVHEVAPVIPW